MEALHNAGIRFKKDTGSEDEEEILRLFPEAKLKTIMQAGHWLHVDKPKVFQKIALNFLADKE